MTDEEARQRALLLEALLPTREKRHAYLTNPTFRVFVENLGKLIPGLVDGVLAEAKEETLKMNALVRTAEMGSQTRAHDNPLFGP